MACAGYIHSLLVQIMEDTIVIVHILAKLLNGSLPRLLPAHSLVQ